MAYTVSWNEATPDGSEDADTLDTELQNLKKSLRERLEDFFPDWSDDGVDPKLPVSGYPRVELGKSGAAQSLTDDTYEALIFTDEDLDQGGMWSGGAATRVTIPAGLGGFYLFVGGAQFNQDSPSPAGSRELAFYKNGSIMLDARSNQADASNDTQPTALINTWMGALAAADYIELFAFQNSGGALDINFFRLCAVRLA